MKIGILGAGKVATALGSGLLARGYQVMISGRTRTESVRAWLEKSPAGSWGSPREAARFGELLILAVNPWSQIETVLASLDRQDIEGKAVLDPSNNIEWGERPRMAFDTVSMGQHVQKLVPEAHVVKTLTLIPSQWMVDPKSHGIPDNQWICGDDARAKAHVAAVLCDLGWTKVYDLGPLTMSQLMEGIGLLVTSMVTQLTAKSLD